MSLRKSKPFLIAALLLVLFGCLSAWLFANQTILNWDEMARATFDSPAGSKNEVWLYDSGFLDRDLSFYAKPVGRRPQFVANVWWAPDAYFSSGQWTKDGKMFVCSMIVKTVGDKPVKAVAFEFSRNKVIMPSWITRVSFDAGSKADWHKQEAVIEEMIAQHGGLSDSRITDGIIKAQEKKLWFWQTPP